MYFDFEDHRPDINPVGSAISLREGVLLSIIAHLGLVIMFLLFWREMARSEAVKQQQAVQAAANTPPMTFVFVPNNNAAPKPPPRAPASDIDRAARDRERPPKVDQLPFSRGNSPDYVDRPPQPAARGRGQQPEPQAGPPETQPQDAVPPPEPTEKLRESPSGLSLPAPKPQTLAGNYGRSALPGGNLGSALNNLQQYTRTETFRNLQGGVGKPGDAIQFDTKGVEFGPWIRRFVERVRNNWNVPMAAMSLKGHVVIQFNIHKNGTITDLAVVGPCPVDSFNTAAYGALVASNPTDPLPPEYPDEKAFFTVTFYYNEQVPE